jgi:hypothetical protein
MWLIWFTLFVSGGLLKCVVGVPKSGGVRRRLPGSDETIEGLSATEGP